MGIIQRIKKHKEVVKIKLSNGIKDLCKIDFSNIIPDNASNLEIKYIDREKILIIDFLVKLEIDNIEK